MEHYLRSMASDENITRSVLDLWHANPNIKDMCKLPLNMVMVVFLAKNDKITNVHTKTQIYLEVMNATISNNQYTTKLNWNDTSLHDCILNQSKSNDKLCSTFHYLLHVAFEMHFNERRFFPEALDIKKYTNILGLVNVTKNGTQVKYEFFHPTFMEFFVALRLLHLPQEERLYFYIKEQSERQVNHNLWLFFFGLFSKFYDKHVFPGDISVVVRQFAMFHSEKEIEQFPPYCQNGMVSGIHERNINSSDES